MLDLTDFRELIRMPNNTNVTWYPIIRFRGNWPNSFRPKTVPTKDEMLPNFDGFLQL